MEDQSFLPHFITEDIYLIQDRPISENPQINRPLILTVEKLKKEDLDFLTKIFAAVSVDPDQMDIQQLSDHLDTERQFIFIFGDTALSLNRYEITKRNHQTLLLADDLQSISQDQQKKRQLWAVLKQVFP